MATSSSIGPMTISRAGSRSAEELRSAGYKPVDGVQAIIIGSLTEKLAEARGKELVAAKTIRDLRSQLRSVEAERADFSSRLKVAEDKIATSSKAHKKLDEQYQIKQKEVSKRIKEVMQSIGDEINRSNEKITVLTERVIKKEEDFLRLQMELARCQAEYGKALEELRAQERSKEEEIQKLKADIAQLLELLKQKTKHIESLTRGREEWDARKAELTQINTKLVTQNVHLQHMTTEQVKYANILQQKLEEQEKRLKVQEELVRSKDQQIELLTQKLHELQAGHKAISTVFDEKTRELLQTRMQLHVTEEKLKKANAQMAHFSAERHTLETALRTERARADALARDLDSQLRITSTVETVLRDDPNEA